MSGGASPKDIVGFLGVLSIDEIVSIMFGDMPDLGAVIDRAVTDTLDK